MKRWVKKLLISGAVIIVVIIGLGYVFRSELQRVAKRYLKHETQRSIVRYGEKLPPIDSVKLLRLDDVADNKSAKRLPVSYTASSEMAISSEKILSGEDAQEFARRWRVLRLHNDYMALCYEPHHAVQFLTRGSVICEAVICFDCGNTTLPGFPMKVMASFESEQDKGSVEYLEFKSMVETAVGTKNQRSSPPP